MKHDLPYFSHYSTTHNEPRMQALLAEYGFEGYGRYWILCEKIASSQNAMLDISSRIIKLTIARELGLSAEGFDSFIGFLSEPDVSLIRFENCLITADQLVEDYQRVLKKRERDRNDHNPVVSPLTDLPIPLTEMSFPVAENPQSRVDKSTVDQSTKDQSSSTSENNEGGNYSQTTTTDFINKCKTLGYSIGRTMAEKISNGMNASWLCGEFTYPEFVDEKIVRRDRYSGKPHDEKLRIFIGTAKEWVEQQEEFQEWRNMKIAEAAKQDERCQREDAAQDKNVIRDASNQNEAEENDMEKVEKAYLLNWDTLFSQGKVKTQNPIVNWNQTRALLKNHFKTLVPEQIIRAVNNGMADDFILKGGYSLATMLSASVMNRLINSVAKQKHRIANDNTTDDDIGQYFTEIGDDISGAQSGEIDF